MSAPAPQLDPQGPSGPVAGRDRPGPLAGRRLLELGRSRRVPAGFFDLESAADVDRTEVEVIDLSDGSARDGSVAGGTARAGAAAAPVPAASREAIPLPPVRVVGDDPQADPWLAFAAAMMGNGRGPTDH